MTNILDGMSREQAHECVWSSGDNKAVLIVGCDVYLNPTGTQQLWHYTAKQLHDIIDTFFDERERQKWVEPEQAVKARVPYCNGDECLDLCGSWHNADADAYLRKVNVRRKIEAWRNANGGSGDWEIVVDDGSLFVESYPAHGAGTITFSTQEAADEARRRYEPELRTLVGGE